MGSGIFLSCKKKGCGYEKKLFYGIGMGFKSQEEEVLNDIRNGKYGEEWKYNLETIPKVIVDYQRCVFRCPKCRDLLVRPGLSQYLLEDASKLGIGRYWPSPTNKAFRMIKEYHYYCEKCNEKLEFIDDPEETVFYCSDCGEELNNKDGIC